MSHGRSVIAVVCLVALGSCWHATGLGETAAQATAPFDKLSLTISCSETELLPMEPCAVVVALSNHAQQGIMGHEMLDPGYEYLEVYVKGPDEKEFRRFYPATRFTKTMWPNPTLIEAGKTVTAEVVLSYGWHDLERRDGYYPLWQPGEYVVKAVFPDLDRKSRIESNELTITVREPEETEKAAVAFLDRNLTKRNFLLETGLGSSVIEQTVEELRSLLKAFPESAYAKYVKYTLATIYAKPYQSVNLGAGVEEAMALLQEVTEYKAFFLTDDALLALVELNIRKGDLKHAEACLLRLKASFPDTAAFQSAEHMYRSASQNR